MLLLLAVPSGLCLLYAVCNCWWSYPTLSDRQSNCRRRHCRVSNQRSTKGRCTQWATIVMQIIFKTANIFSLIQFAVMHDSGVHRFNRINRINCGLANQSTRTIKYPNTKNVPFFDCVRVFTKFDLSMFVYIPSVGHCIGLVHSNGNNSNYQTTAIVPGVEQISRIFYR